MYRVKSKRSPRSATGRKSHRHPTNPNGTTIASLGIPSNIPSSPHKTLETLQYSQTRRYSYQNNGYTRKSQLVQSRKCISSSSLASESEMVTFLTTIPKDHMAYPMEVKSMTTQSTNGTHVDSHDKHLNPIQSARNVHNYKDLQTVKQRQDMNTHRSFQVDGLHTMAKPLKSSPEPSMPFLTTKLRNIPPRPRIDSSSFSVNTSLPHAPIRSISTTSSPHPKSNSNHRQTTITMLPHMAHLPATQTHPTTLLTSSKHLQHHTHQTGQFHSTAKTHKTGRAAQKAAGGLDRAALSRGEHLEQLTLLQTLGKLAPYIWPKGNNANKARVIASLICLFSSKILNVATPILFKEAINSLTEHVPNYEKYSKLASERVNDVKDLANNAKDTINSTVDNASAMVTEKTKQVAEEFDKATKKLGETLDNTVTPLKSSITSSASPPSDQTKDFTQSIIKDFFKILTEPEFLNISTTAVPFAILIAYGLVRVVSSLTNELKSAIFTRVTTDALRVLASDLLRHLLHMDLAFHLERNTGAISLAIDRGNKSLGMVLNMITFRIIPTIFEIGLVLGVLSTQCGLEYTAVALATLVSYIWYTIAITNWRTKFRQDMNRHSNQASSIAFDSLMNVDTVQRFNNQDHEVKKYSKVFEGLGEATIKNESSLSLLNWGQFSIFSIGMTAVMLFAAKGVMEGTMTVGDLVMVNALLFQLSIPLNIVGTVYRELKQAVLDMQTMFALRSTKSLIANAPDAVDLTAHHEKIKEQALQEYLTKHNLDKPPANWKPPGLGLKLRDVKFHYPNDTKQVIDGITLDIEPGTSVAFVGGSGCGKSTLLKLTSRQHDVISGSIEIGGIPIKQIELSSLSRNIGVVPQETTLFNDTIMYNIRYAKPSASDEEVHNAARLANIHHSIMNMMNGYDTIVGERGLKLSGGEKQRVSISRMMLVNPPIVFCDEATSALDSATEFEIMQNLRSITQNKTCLYVAHRLSTITHCDKIVVIDKGRVVEQGTHQELLRVNDGDGVYARMWRYQSTVGNLDIPAAELAEKGTGEAIAAAEHNNTVGDPGDVRNVTSTNSINDVKQSNAIISEATTPSKM